MPAIVKSLRSMKSMGILADRDGKTPITFRRYNLIYGFNGSGKSTLSRLFASFQSGTRDARLTENSSFSVELDDETELRCPDNLTGLQNRILVFNTDFVDQNLQWSTARANPVFYIGEAQAAFAEELKGCRERFPDAERRVAAAVSAIKAREKLLQVYRRDRARLIAEQLHLRGRKYEAPQLIGDYSQLDLSGGCELDESTLESYRATCRLAEPPAEIQPLSLGVDDVASALGNARAICGVAPSTKNLPEFERHPQMLVWATEGHQYHTEHNLSDCLFCQNSLSQERLVALEDAFETGGVDRILFAINSARDKAISAQLQLARIAAPNVFSLLSSLKDSYETALTTFGNKLAQLQSLASAAVSIVEEKRRAPGSMTDASSVPTERDAGTIVAALHQAAADLNSVIESHNRDVEAFAELQEKARVAIRKHYLAEVASEHSQLVSELVLAEEELQIAQVEEKALRDRMRGLESEIREHGPAADAINKLLRSYLGHSELTVVAVGDGYEIHRQGRLITGVPSEGEKTAIALCYFLSMLQSDGRRTRDLIVVVDDPISSLDSRSLNFACNLIKSRLNDAAQLFVLTHNLNCVNEFRKPWKSKARPPDGSDPTAALLFLDVAMPVGAEARRTQIIDLPALLREYDSEYHYLVYHALKFSEAGREYEYAYMMPNLLRRVLEVFLAFRCPGSAGLTSKIEQLCKAHPNLDRDRIGALERLTQVESHSDNLDDLISFSSMTLEETKSATDALLSVMTEVDPSHTAGLRRICR